MRLLLDAHISGRVVGRRLRAGGHDVVAVEEHRELEGATDAELLALATREGRIVVTHNVKDVPDLARAWAEAHQPHAGCAVVVGIRTNEFGRLIDAIERALLAMPEQGGWSNALVFVTRAP